MNIQQFRYFLALGEELHFRRAAERLHLSQPALTRSVRQLEAALGFTLLERDNRNVSLTPAGKQFLEGCKSVVATIDEMTERARRTAKGELGQIRIGYTDIAVAGILPDVVRGFRAAFPNISVSANHGCTQAQIDDLEDNRLDLGFFTGPWSKPGYETWTVQRDPFVVVLPANHALAAAPFVSLKQVADEPFVLGEPRFWAHYHAHLYSLCRAAGFEPRVVQYASNNEGILGLVACGIGISILAGSVRAAAREGITLRLIDEADHVPTIAAWRSGSRNPVTDHLAGYVKATYRQALDFRDQFA